MHRLGHAGTAALRAQAQIAEHQWISAVVLIGFFRLSWVPVDRDPDQISRDGIASGVVKRAPHDDVIRVVAIRQLCLFQLDHEAGSGR
jgi:hypothetical protein